MEERYSRKEITIAILASLLIVILCVTLVMVGLRIMTQRTISGVIQEVTPGSITQISGQSSQESSFTPTPDLLETIGATLVASQVAGTSVSSGSAPAYGLQTDLFSIIVFVVIILVVIGGIILLDRYTRLQSEKKKHKP